MKLTPLDIQQKQFTNRWRGLDPQEVRHFLEVCADQIEDLTREIADLREEVRSRDAQVAQAREHEHTLQEALVSAQRLATEMKDQARKEADIALADASLEADKIVRDAHGRRAQLLNELASLRSMKVAFEGDIRALANSHLKLLETFSDSDRRREQTERVALLQKKDSA